MKSILSLCLCCLVTFLFAGCSPSETPEDRLNAVLRGELECITEDGIFQPVSELVPDSEMTAYTFIDMDGDGTDELLVSLAAKADTEYGIVMLRDEEDEVRAWLFSIRQMNDIRADGSFCASDSAAESWYSKIDFVEGRIQKTELAYCHGIENIYRLNGSAASREEVEGFIKERQSLAFPEWIPTNIENLTVLADEENYRVEMTEDQEFVHFYIRDNAGKVLEDSWNSASRYLGIEKDGDLLVVRYGLGTVGATYERYYDLAEGKVSRWYDVCARDGRRVYLFKQTENGIVLQIANIFESDGLTKTVSGDYPDCVLTLLPESFTVSAEEISFVYANGTEKQTVCVKLS